jgi:hypothetical protein
MSLINPIRSYFRARLAEVNTSFTEWDDAFWNENIPRSVFDKAYHIALNSVSSGPLNHQIIRDMVAVTIRLLTSSNKDNQFDFDAAVDEAHSFRQNCVNPAKFTSQVNIKNVICQSITPSYLQNNDSAIIIEISFNVECVWKAIKE